MYRNLLIIVALFSSIQLVAQPYMEWQKTLGGSAEDIARVIEPTADGGFIVAGQTRSEDGDVSVAHGWVDYWVVKLSNAGTIEWEKSFGGTNHDLAWDIFPTTDGGFIVAGSSESEDGQVTGQHGLDDYWVVKMDSVGTMEWQKTYGGYDNEFCRSIQQTSDGGYIIGGASRSTNGDVSGNHGKYDFWIVKTAENGDIEWEKSLGGSKDEFLEALQQTTDGGYILTGKTLSNDGDVSGHHGGGNFVNDIWVVKVNDTGEIEWQKCLGSTDHEASYSVQQTNDEGYIVSGFSRADDGDLTENFGDYDFWIVKLESDGDIEWQKSLGSFNADMAHDVRQTSDGGYIAVGFTDYVPGINGGRDYLAIKLTPTGEKDWQIPLGGTGTDRAFSIRQTEDEGFVMTGRTTSSNGDVTGYHGGTDFWVVKLGPCGVNPELEVDDDFVIQSSDISLSTTHQWIDCSDGSTIEGVEGSSFAPADGGEYAVILSNGACIDTSECIYVCPLDDWVIVGSDIIISEEDSPDVSYQWIDCSDGSIIEGETDYYFEPTLNGQYAVILTEDNCSVTSICRTVCPETIITEVIASSTTLQSMADTASTFQWIDCSNGASIEGATSPVFTPTISGEYAVEISRVGCSETSECFTVCLVEPGLSVDENTISSLADPAYSDYQWIDCNDGSAISGATDQMFSPAISGDYAVIIAQGSCTDTSECVTICQVDSGITVSESLLQSMADPENSTFQWIDCSDSSAMEGEINQIFEPNISGEYAVIVTQGSCIDTSECAAVCLVNTEIVVSENTLQSTADSLTSSFQWIDCNSGAIIEGATGPVFEPTVSGDYAVMVTQGSCTETSDCTNMVVVDVEEPANRGVKIFPNPVKDFIIAETRSGFIGTDYVIYDKHGKQIASGSISSHRALIETGDFPTGIYILEIKSQEETISLRFVKN